MLKALSFLSAVLIVTPSAIPVQAAECIYRCRTNEVRFIPGQALQLEVINNTGGRVNLERVLDFRPYRMWPEQTITIDAQVGVGDLSVVFWEATNRSIEVRLHRPDVNRLQIELLPSGALNDSAVHIVNDGRVLIY